MSLLGLNYGVVNMARHIPARNATTDANAGTINPPAAKSSGARVSSTRQLDNSALDKGVEAFGNTLGGVVDSKLEEATESINTRRISDAVARQDASELEAARLQLPEGNDLALTDALAKRTTGVDNNTLEQQALNRTIQAGQEHAINSIDANKKRMGWERGVFGENIEYRAAQQRAAENAVQDGYLQQATEISEFAGETPTEYAIRLKDGLNTILEPYGGDVETKRIVTAAWAKASAKLSAKQYEEHYAWNQVQQRDTYSKQVEGNFNALTVDATLITTAEEADLLMEGAAKMFTNDAVPKGMNKLAARSVMNEQVGKQLRENNIGAYKAAKAAGWIEGLNPKEMQVMDSHIAAYDNDFNKELFTMTDRGYWGIKTANTPDEALAMFPAMLNEVDSAEMRSTESPAGDKAIAAARVRILKMREQALKEASRRGVAIVDQRNLEIAVRDPDPVSRAGKYASLQSKTDNIGFKPATKKDIIRVLDETIVDDIAMLSGAKGGMTQDEALTAMMANPKIAGFVSDRMNGRQIQSAFVTRATTTFINGFHTLTNEDGQLNEKGIAAMQSIAQFAQDEETFKLSVGTAASDDYDIIRRGMSVGETTDMIRNKLDLFHVNAGDRDAIASRWPLPKDTTKREYVANLVRQFDPNGNLPEGQSLSVYMKDYDKALVMYQGDHQAAGRYLNTSVRSAGLAYDKYYIPGGQKLNDVTSFNFDELMRGVQNVPASANASLLTGYLEVLNPNRAGKDNNPSTWRTSVNDVKGLKMYVVDGVDGFFLTSDNAQGDVHIDEAQMLEWDETLTQRNEMDTMVRVAQEEARIRDDLETWEDASFKHGFIKGVKGAIKGAISY